MTSIRQQVFEFLKLHEKTSLKETKKKFKDCPSGTIGGYYREYHHVNENTRLKHDLDIKQELIKIIKDYKQPASARVQAIREYNNLVETQPQESEEPLLKLLTILEKDTSDSQK